MERIHFAAVAAVLVVFAATMAPVDAGARKVVETCMQQTGSSKADLEQFMRNQEASQPMKCTMSCALQAIHFMTADGTIDTAAFKSKMPAAVGGLIDTCANQASPETDVCQRAYTMLRCFTTAEPKIFVQFVTTD